MDIWMNFNFNEPLKDELVTKIDDVTLPVDYIEFMKVHNGGELFGIDMEGNYFTVPAIMSEEDKRCISKNLDDFMISLNEFMA